MEFELNQALLGHFASEIETLLQNESFLNQLKQQDLLSEAEIEQCKEQDGNVSQGKLFQKLRTKNDAVEKLVTVFGTSPTYPKASFLAQKEALLQKIDINKGLALQISTARNNIFEVNEPLLYQTLNKAEDKKVFILSLNGRFRGGKSFLLTQALKYLMFSEGNANWLEKELSSPFEYNADADAVTKGIQIWSEPFIKGDIAVFLMDCQGLLDADSNEMTNATLFSFSSMISSDFVLNDKRNTEDAFKWLHAYLKFANVTGNDKESRMKFTFLQRDWENEHEYAFGLHTSTTQPAGSAGNLKGYLFNARPDQAPAVQETKQAIEGLTGDIVVFAMPHPQNNIPDTNLPPSQWEPNFRKYVVEFLEMKLGALNIQENLKKIGGKVVTGGELKMHVEAWCPLLQDRENFPEMESLLSVTANLQEIGILKKYMEEYETKLGAILDANPQGMVATLLDQQQSEIVKGIEAAFCSEKLINDDQAGMLNRLRSSIAEIWTAKQQVNNDRVRQAAEIVEAARVAAEKERQRVEAEKAAQAAEAARVAQAARLAQEQQLRQQAKQARIQAAEVEVKNALDHMNWAQSHSDAVGQNTAAFNYQETVATKHRPRVLGIKVSPYYTYETVTKFNADAYNGAVQQAQSGHREAEVRYNNALANLQNAKNS